MSEEKKEPTKKISPEEKMAQQQAAKRPASKPLNPDDVSQVQELTEERDNLIAVRDQLAEANTDLQKQIEELSDEKDTLESSVEELTAENTELKSRVEQLEAQLSAKSEEEDTEGDHESDDTSEAA